MGGGHSGPKVLERKRKDIKERCWTLKILQADKNTKLITQDMLEGKEEFL